MTESTVTIRNKTGLHMRPAEMIVRTASQFCSDISIIKDDLAVNGKSIMGVMMLAAECGSDIVIQVDGEDEMEALAALVDVVEQNFGETA